jgi:uncharacterized protein YggE
MKLRFTSAGLVCGVALVLLSGQGAYAEDRKVAVSGVCHRSAVPDRASLVLVADFREMDLKAAIRKATETYGRMRDGIERLKLEDLELRTSEYSVNQVREWEKNQSVFKGYQVRMGLKVASSSIARMGEVIAIGAREDVRETGALSTYLSDEKLLREQVSCLEEAAKNARTKAEKLAGALGAKVGPVLSLSESWDALPRPPAPLAMGMMSARAADVEAPKIEGGRQDLSVTVQASFGLQ